MQASLDLYICLGLFENHEVDGYRGQLRKESGLVGTVASNGSAEGV